MRPLHRPRLVLSLFALLGCASTVDGALGSADGGTGDGAIAPGDGGACAQWVLTDREERTGEELFTDLHLTFDAQGQLAERRENIRTGGHGKNRTYRAFTYRWSAAELVVSEVGDDTERTTYTLDGARLTARVRASANPALRGAVQWERDDAGRVVAKVETRAGAATPSRCAYQYDPAGRLHEIACTDGELARYQWDGARPVRRDRTWRGMYPGFDTWQWDPRGALVQEQHDDGYGPGRLYRNDHLYDDAGRLVRSESVLGSPPTRRPTAGFGYDAQGRLAREERDFDAAGVARSVVRWTRDAEGRVAARLTGEGGEARYTYAVTPSQIDVTVRAGAWQSSRRYRCFAAPVRIPPADPTPGVPIASVYPEAGDFPANAVEP
ncbi:MAG: hypothetical protein U0325_09530 [Polyangiales bacterium]